MSTLNKIPTIEINALQTEPMHVDSNAGIEQMIQTELLAQSILTEDERKAMIKAKRAEAASHARQVKKEKKKQDDQAIREKSDPPSLIEKMKKSHPMELSSDGRSVRRYSMEPYIRSLNIPLPLTTLLAYAPALNSAVKTLLGYDPSRRNSSSTTSAQEDNNALLSQIKNAISNMPIEEQERTFTNLMCAHVIIGNKVYEVMIDSGATDSIIPLQVLKENKLEHLISPANISLDFGGRMVEKAVGLAKNVMLYFSEEISVPQKFIAVAPGDSAILLGRDFLHNASADISSKRKELIFNDSDFVDPQVGDTPVVTDLHDGTGRNSLVGPQKQVRFSEEIQHQEKHNNNPSGLVVKVNQLNLSGHRKQLQLAQELVLNPKEVVQVEFQPDEVTIVSSNEAWIMEASMSAINSGIVICPTISHKSLRPVSIIANTRSDQVVCLPKGAVISVLTPTGEVDPKELENRNNIEKDTQEVMRYMESFTATTAETVVPSVI